ncbi:hypothetical protein V1511DRAFT_497744 [Dipodascopsis uninucleata]
MHYKTMKLRSRFQKDGVEIVATKQNSTASKIQDDRVPTKDSYRRLVKRRQSQPIQDLDASANRLVNHQVLQVVQEPRTVKAKSSILNNGSHCSNEIDDSTIVLKRPKISTISSNTILLTPPESTRQKKIVKLTTRIPDKKSALLTNTPPSPERRNGNIMKTANPKIAVPTRTLYSTPKSNYALKSKFEGPKIVNLSSWSSSHDKDSKDTSFLRPVVWSNTLNELSEAYPYFDDYANNCFKSDGFARGFILNEELCNRHILENVVIFGINLTDGPRAVADECKSLLKSWRHFIPIVLITSNDINILRHSRPSRKYCILDWFLISHSWCALDDTSTHKLRMFRLERLGINQQSPWWIEKSSTNKLFASLIEEFNCEACKRSSPRLYLEPICLFDDCELFWKTPEGSKKIESANFSEYALKTISYKFKLRRPFEHISLSEFRGPLHTGAWRCSTCGKLNIRELWDGWYCSADNCTGSLRILDDVDRSLSKPSQFRSTIKSDYFRLTADSVEREDSIDVKTYTYDTDCSDLIYISRRFISTSLPSLNTIYHIMPLTSLLHDESEPDHIVRAYKNSLSLFRRYPKEKTCATELSGVFNRYFSYRSTSEKIEDLPLCIKLDTAYTKRLISIALKSQVSNCRIRVLESIAFIEGLSFYTLPYSACDTHYLALLILGFAGTCECSSIGLKLSVSHGDLIALEGKNIPVFLRSDYQFGIISIAVIEAT